MMYSNTNAYKRHFGGSINMEKEQSGREESFAEVARKQRVDEFLEGRKLFLVYQVELLQTCRELADPNE